jgi:hypothetical protein
MNDSNNETANARDTGPEVPSRGTTDNQLSLISADQNNVLNIIRQINNNERGGASNATTPADTFEIFDPTNPTERPTNPASDTAVAQSGDQTTGAPESVESRTSLTDASERPPELRTYSMDDIREIVRQQLAANGGDPMQMVKGYYEARVTEVQPPNQVIMPTTEHETRLTQDVTVQYADGRSVTLRAGELLPNGLQFVSSSVQDQDGTRTLDGAMLRVDTADGTIRLADGRVIETGGTIAGSFDIQGGHHVNERNRFIVARDSIDPSTGQYRLDTYTNNDMSRWNEVPGRPGVYSPTPARMGGIPTNMIQLPYNMERGTMLLGDGRFSGQGGDWVVLNRNANGLLEPGYIVSRVDNLQTYIPHDERTRIASEASLTDLRMRGIEVATASPTREEFNINRLIGAHNGDYSQLRRLLNGRNRGALGAVIGAVAVAPSVVNHLLNPATNRFERYTFGR